MVLIAGIFHGFSSDNMCADLETAIASVSVTFWAMALGPLKIKNISSSLLLERSCQNPACGKQAQWQQEEVGSVFLAHQNQAVGVFHSLSRERGLL